MRVKCSPRTSKKSQRKTNLLKKHWNWPRRSAQITTCLLTKNNDLIKSLEIFICICYEIYICHIKVKIYLCKINRHLCFDYIRRCSVKIFVSSHDIYAQMNGTIRRHFGFNERVP